MDAFLNAGADRVLAGSMRVSRPFGSFVVALLGVVLTFAYIVTPMPAAANGPGVAGLGPSSEVSTATARAEFTAVSCVDATDCTAVGNQGAQPMYSVETNGDEWSTPVTIPSPTPLSTLPWTPFGSITGGFSGVSCVDPENCTAVGYEDYFAKVPDPNSPFGADDGYVAGQPIVAVETDGNWAPAINIAGGSPGSWLTSVSCVDPENCTAVGVDDPNGVDGGYPITVTETAGAWGSVTILPITPILGSLSLQQLGGFNSVSCTDALDCAAVGWGILATMSAGVWSETILSPSETASTISGDLFTGVSCVDATDCTAVGQTPGYEPTTSAAISVVMSGSKWGTVSSAGGGSFSNVSCTDATDCMAVGEIGTQPTYSIGSASGFGAPTAVVSPGGSGDFAGVSCPDGLDCTAVGADGNDLPMYSTGVIVEGFPPLYVVRKSGTGTVAAISTKPDGQTLTVTGIGAGTITIGQYQNPPVTPLPNTTYLDVKVSPSNTFTSLTMTVCPVTPPSQLQWWNPAANLGTGGYVAVASNVTTLSGATCVQSTLTTTTTPNIADLSGTVFALSGAGLGENLPETPSMIALPVIGALILGGGAWSVTRRRGRRREPGGA